MLEVFDWGLYGYMIRRRRLNIGYQKAEDFAPSVWRRTRVEIGTTTLYKIEQGRQKPSAEVFMALNMALFGEFFPAEIVEHCLSKEWGELRRNGGDIPETWALENVDRVSSDINESDISAARAAIVTGDKRELFSDIPF